jgi:hypothetical protein
MESMRVSRDVEALDLELKGWEKAQTNKGTTHRSIHPCVPPMIANPVPTENQS